MSDAIPQRDALRIQLALIAGKEPASSFLEIRPLTIDGKPALDDRAFIPVNRLGDAAGRIAELAPRLGVYIGVAPRVRESGTAADVARVWCLWADCDGKEALERLREFRPKPSMVIRSGSPDSVHAYWALSSASTPDGAQRANRRLALALGADMAATDPARILRPAGSLNHKTAPPAEVVCTRLELDTFALGDVVGHLQDDMRYRPLRQAQAPVGHDITGDPSKVLEGLVRVVRDAPLGNRNRALFWSSCRVAEHAETGAVVEDQAQEELRRAGLDVGLAEHEVEQTLRSGLARRSEARAA